MIQLRGFTKRYGRLEAVGALDLTIAPGEAFGLIGPNGSGKSTLMRALAGLHAPSAGGIVIDGVDVGGSSRRPRGLVSYLPQRVSLPPLATPRDALALYAGLKGIDVAQVEPMLKRLALLEKADAAVGELSGGMVQRLGLAIAFIGAPKVLVLDEPTVNLDALGIDCFGEMIGEAKGRGVTLVFSSHVLDVATQLGDRVGVLVEGRLAAVESAQHFRARLARATVVRLTVEEASQAMVDAALGAGAASSTCNGQHVSFCADAHLRIAVIRAVEAAGGIIRDLQTQPPSWHALVDTMAPGETL